MCPGSPFSPKSCVKTIHTKGRIMDSGCFYILYSTVGKADQKMK